MAETVKPSSDLIAMTQEQLHVMASALVTRGQFANQVGLQFGTTRDLYNVLGYARDITLQKYYQRYRRDGIASRIITALPQATWRNTPTVRAVGDLEGKEEFTKKFAELDRKTSVFQTLARMDKLSGIGRYGVLLIGLRASGPLEDQVTTRRSRDVEDVMYYSTFMEESATIKTLGADPTKSTFGQPLSYQLKLFGVQNNSEIPGSPTELRNVHHSRTLHIAEGTEEDSIFGTPRLEAVYNYLDDLDKIIGGTGEAFWRVIDRGMQFDIDKDANMSDEDAATFTDEIEDYVHGLKRYIRTQGIKTTVLGSDAPDPTGAAVAVLGLIAGTTGIPQRVLTGSERGQLASNQDERNFNARARERQTLFAEPSILIPFVDRMIAYKVLPAVPYEIIWPDLSTLTDKEKADVAARRAQAAGNIVKIGPDVLSNDEKRRIFFDLPPMENPPKAGTPIEPEKPQEPSNE